MHASGLCLDTADVKAGERVVINPCTGADTQKWEFEKYFNLDAKAA